MLSSLVTQLLEAPPKAELTLRVPTCPRCPLGSPQPRTRSITSGKLLAYCRECYLAVQEENNAKRRK